jgi:hypothetical protein
VAEAKEADELEAKESVSADAEEIGAIGAEEIGATGEEEICASGTEEIVATEQGGIWAADAGEIETAEDTEIVISPWSVNLTALESRLTRTWRRRVKSPSIILGTESSIWYARSSPFLKLLQLSGQLPLQCTLKGQTSSSPAQFSFPLSWRDPV